MKRIGGEAPAIGSSSSAINEARSVVLHYTIGQAIGQAPGNPEQVEACLVCGQNHPFEMPEEIVTAALDGKLVIFAGAGVSTESRRVDESTFAERIAEELGLAGERPTFPLLMTAYEDAFGRPQLLQRIRERFDYIKAFPELWRLATRFHHALATAYFLDQIITTNWDTYFEDVAAATPIVVAEDYAFWDLEGRKVFKLHGSMNNLGTVVATDDDYARCYRRLRDGVIGASIRHLLATKRAVFIGYSFGDPDLNRILRFLRKELADILPRSYLVTPHGYEGKEFPIGRVIKTDGAYFIQKLKDAAVQRNQMRSDRVFARTLDLAGTVEEAHEHVSRASKVRDTPAVIYTLAYQDGLKHAFERVYSLLPSGHYSNPHSTYHVVPTYGLIVRGAIRKRHYWHAAYAQGYLNAMMSLDLDDANAKTLPLYWVWGADHDLRKFRDFERELKRAARLHKSATAEAVRLVRDVPDGVVVHHNAYLDANGYIEAATAKKSASRPKKRRAGKRSSDPTSGSEPVDVV